MRKAACFLAGLLLAGLSQTSNAAEVTRVASSFEETDRFDIHFGVGYQYQFKQAAVLREWNPGGMNAPRNRLVKDLVFRHQRHTINTNLEIGIWRDLSIYFALPIIVHDTRDYALDQREDDCTFGDDVPPSPTANCVNKNNSTTVRDRIIPRHGVDATSLSNPFQSFTGPMTELIFRGPVRRGVDQLYVGIKYGILNQEKRAHMPTWIIAAEGRFGVGRPMTFSRDLLGSDAPEGNNRIGQRVHELGFWTALSRRHRFLEPFFTAYWRQSIAGSGSRFRDERNLGAQTRRRPQSHAGVSVGTEIIPWERKARNLKVALLLTGQADLNYGGRGYSEVWELLADSPAMVGSYDPTRANQCDREAALAFAEQMPGSPGYITAGGPSCAKFDGITDIQNYATFAFDAAVNFHLGAFARLTLGANVSTSTRHFVTFTSRGDVDAGGTDPELVESGTKEVNPLRRDVVDNVGRRYAVDDVVTVYPYVNVLITF